MGIVYKSIASFNQRFCKFVIHDIKLQCSRYPCANTHFAVSSYKWCNLLIIVGFFKVCSLSRPNKLQNKVSTMSENFRRGTQKTLCSPKRSFSWVKMLTGHLKGSAAVYDEFSSKMSKKGTKVPCIILWWCYCQHFNLSTHIGSDQIYFV